MGVGIIIPLFSINRIISDPAFVVLECRSLPCFCLSLSLTATCLHKYLLAFIQTNANSGLRHQVRHTPVHSRSPVIHVSFLPFLWSIISVIIWISSQFSLLLSRLKIIPSERVIFQMGRVQEPESSREWGRQGEIRRRIAWKGPKGSQRGKYCMSEGWAKNNKKKESENGEKRYRDRGKQWVGGSGN